MDDQMIAKAPVFIGALIVFSIVNLAIGLFQKNKTSMNSITYASYPNSTEGLPLFLSISSTIVGGGMFFAVSQIGYEAGIAGLFLGISYFFGLCILGALSPYIRKVMKDNGCLTISQFLEVKYPGKSALFNASNIYRATILLIFLMFLSAQIITLSFFVNNIFPASEKTSLTAAAIIIFVFNTTVYVFVGGLQKDILTDVWQMGLVIVGTLLFVFSVNDPLVIKNLDQNYFVGINKGYPFVAGVLLFTGPALLTRPDMWQRIIAAKSDSIAKWSFVFSGVISFLFYAIFTFIGMHAKATGVLSSENIIFSFMSGTNLSYISLAILLAFLGAVMSSADTFLNVFSVNFGEIVLSSNNDDTRLIVMRLSTILATVIALVIAFTMPDLVDLFAAGFGALLIFLPALWASLFVTKTNPAAALWSTSIGVFVYLLFVSLFPLEAFVPGLIVSVVTFFSILKYSNNRSSHTAKD